MHVADEQLAAFFDGELSPEEYRIVEAHVRTCARCRQVLDDMVLVQKGLRALAVPEPPEDLWYRIDRTPAALRRMRPVRELRRRARAVVAASVALLAVALSVLALLTQDRGQVPAWPLPVVSAEAPFNLGLYLEALDHAGQMPSLPASYQQRQMSDEEALRAVTRTAALDVKALPSALTLEEAYLIEREGFRMAQLIYRHSRGSVLIFAQPRDYAVSFSGFPAEPVVVEARRCLSVRCGVYRAYCFSTEAATYTVVGRYGDPTVIQIIKTLSSD